jgi:predicted methyltransferase
MPEPVILSHYQAGPLLSARGQGQARAATSPDLGISRCEVELDEAGVAFPGGHRVGWSSLEEIAESDVSCFRIEDGEIHKIQIFSEFTGRFYSLMPTAGAPTMLLSGIPMHRIKGIDPYQDTLLKIQAIQPVTGSVLDTTMGLGYTAIEAARTAEQVTTIELDPAVPELAAQNPWSRGLFDNQRIRRVTGDSFERIEDFADLSFSRVIHDPPTFSLAGELYSGEFYRQLYRVLRHNGRLFHYIGDLESTSGSRVAKGAARRLHEAGFKNVKYIYRAFGLTAHKSYR